MTFQEAQLRLLAYVRGRIQSGELTERRLARLIGISQPHVHNVLKGVRNLSPEIFDLILNYFRMSLLDLVPAEELQAHLGRRGPRERVAEAAFLDAPIGPGMLWRADINWRRSYPLPFPSEAAPAGMLMARLVTDPYMYATLADCDIVLLNTGAPQRASISPAGVYVVSHSEETVIRYIRSGARCYYLANDATLDNPIRWEQFRVSAGELFEAVKARVIWVGRERDRDLPMAQRGRFLPAAMSS